VGGEPPSSLIAMRFVVLGVGAIGGVVASHLARAGFDVLAVARGAHLDAIRARGLRVESPQDTFVAHVAAVDDPVRVSWAPHDVVLLAVKTQDAAAAMRNVPAHVPVVCLTNGVEAERIAARHVGTVYGACVVVPATHLEPGVVQAWSTPVLGRIDIGDYPEGAGASDAIVTALRAGGFASSARADIMRWKRGKLLWNLGNAIEALCGHAENSAHIEALTRAEGIACFAAAGLSRTTDDEDALLGRELTMGTIRGAEHTGGSTWQSLARAIGTVETDYLNGEVVLLGRLHGVRTPINEGLQQLMRDAARAKAAPGGMSMFGLELRLGLR
jgi:2-dehydropantoate 2-reductase